ncbi:PREDICTED: von Willebrand factor A domain-containing protein 5A-like [Nanorana parkeri]|uniref:von Willebrand factor A domain-containing protein 5A-like n=1 Tax=Nanorana parkeri TaxID=125878 RepID=UPI000854E969|nr:PREDICTED: von Willebrand factor A domain-containing protein 5A-like [Nanorana parkeri]
MTQVSECFAFGIGEGASTSLIKGMARAGNGTFEFITGKDRMQPKVLRALKFSLQPTVKDVSLKWTLPSGVEAIVLSKVPTTIFQGQRSIVYAQLKGKVENEAEGEVSLQYKFKDEVVKNDIRFPLNVQSAERPTIHRLAAKALISELEHGTESQSEEVKKKILETSLQSGVVSSLTAYVAINKDTKTRVEGPPVRRDIPAPAFMMTQSMPRIMAFGASPMPGSLGGVAFNSAPMSGALRKMAKSPPESAGTRDIASFFVRGQRLVPFSEGRTMPPKVSAKPKAAGDLLHPNPQGAGKPAIKAPASQNPLSQQTAWNQTEGQAGGSGICCKPLELTLTPGQPDWRVLSGEMGELRQQVASSDNRVSALSVTVSTHNACIDALEATQAAHRSHLQQLQLRVEDGENRSRRNNIRLRGIPEATQGPHLHATVTAILNSVLGKPPTEPIELDRVHRVAGAGVDRQNLSVGDGPLRMKMASAVPISTTDLNFEIEESTDLLMGMDDSFSPPPPPPPAPLVETPALLKLISLQNADGSWKLTPEFSAVLGISETDIKAKNPNQNVEVSVWVTVLAVIWLHATSLDEREEWELLEGKAVSWFRARAGSSLGEFVRAGNELLKSSVNPKVFGL